uniref:DUF2059 domain-containing protein n=1 Tax=uncultured Thiotrichaceae bacterium TaxID=298394 RepID=A0A6S6TAI9_9GAMM|nr:MAG: Unknown protein [uncultured Thiotrichaceae bacterium]
MIKTLLLVFSLLLLHSNTFAQNELENTLENRKIQAERYLQVNSAQDIFQDISARTQSVLPENERTPFMELMTKHLDVRVLNETMNESLIKHFTAQEIAVLADFYSIPEAKSAMSKMGVYMADVIPVVQLEMFKAQQKAMQNH